MPYGTYITNTAGETSHMVGSPLPVRTDKPAVPVSYDTLLSPLTDAERRAFALHMRYAAQLANATYGMSDWDTLFDTLNAATLTDKYTVRESITGL